MKRQVLVATSVLAAVWFAGVPLGAQSTGAKGGASTPTSTYRVPKTADGQPNLQGIWANNNITPLERPAAYANRATFTDAELAALKKRTDDLLNSEQAGDIIGDRLLLGALEDPNLRPFDADTGNYNSFWIADRVWSNRTSLITSPENGRVPPFTPDAEKREKANAEYRRAHFSEGPEDLPLGHRCANFGIPRLGSGYNSYFQIVQSATHVAILSEMAHDVRMIPLDSRPYLDESVRQWNGDSRAYFEGNTLVVETRNFSPKSEFRGSHENLRLIERFTRVGPDTLNWEVTAEDATTWTQPWTALIPLKRSNEQIFEYACHEGNVGMFGALSGARAQEREAAASKKGSR